ncbi:dithiol-disulfide isomerase [Pasteurellaceae bacterium 15-036681]|nr:dithiol-disulfide isomerase [Pasteurellaceae bacterium 15-036681]
MSAKTEILFSNQWDVRISDPGLEGALSHYFETVYLKLVAHIDGDKVSYEFTRKVEKEVQTHCIFHDVEELFKFLAEYLGPVALGNIGIKIGQLGLA